MSGVLCFIGLTVGLLEQRFKFVIQRQDVVGVCASCDKIQPRVVYRNKTMAKLMCSLNTFIAQR